MKSVPKKNPYLVQNQQAAGTFHVQMTTGAHFNKTVNKEHEKHYAHFKAGTHEVTALSLASEKLAKNCKEITDHPQEALELHGNHVTNEWLEKVFRECGCDSVNKTYLDLWSSDGPLLKTLNQELETIQTAPTPEKYQTFIKKVDRVANEVQDVINFRNEQHQTARGVPKTWDSEILVPGKTADQRHLHIIAIFENCKRLLTLLAANATEAKDALMATYQPARISDTMWGDQTVKKIQNKLEQQEIKRNVDEIEKRCATRTAIEQKERRVREAIEENERREREAEEASAQYLYDQREKQSWEQRHLGFLTSLVTHNPQSERDLTLKLEQDREKLEDFLKRHPKALDGVLLKHLFLGHP